MSVETIYTLRRAEPVFRDLDSVVLRAEAVTDDGDTMPAGAAGTIVYVAPDMQTLIVEFAEPEGALVTIPASAVIPAAVRAK
ncbi:hypothetical protein [Methylobacterium pseudosasicola]|uniref:DUF4926 domain-containing protein n=1 Tax=Methylobacterium pseudosasicola TaxID=582667 RepID=A0A1I4H788_9HYPH|nr:hypothetical protein [Methylobacterium pseudosasicola]SFL37523.1 hypothetical protein SAMN05192568_100447 [Methylobacterium pseudosasicola]